MNVSTGHFYVNSQLNSHAAVLSPFSHCFGVEGVVNGICILADYLSLDDTSFIATNYLHIFSLK